jgi:formylglycine-generating enzyme required for sulfatase activity
LDFFAAFLIVAGVESALSQAPVITAFDRHGELICTHLEPGSLATVESAPTPVGPWTDEGNELEPQLADPTGAARFLVPMLASARFCRVRGTAADPAPANMVLVPAGSFTMGDSFDEGEQDEQPLHTVHLPALYVDRYEVTDVLWNEVYQWARTNDYQFDNHEVTAKATQHPVYRVNWYDAVKWCNARSEMEKRVPAYYLDANHASVYRTGQADLPNDWVNWTAGYRLPTEAEWEKAARGGIADARYSLGNTIAHTNANYYSLWDEDDQPVDPGDVSETDQINPAFRTGRTPHTNAAGALPANGFGIYDLVGNVWEWCWDYYADTYYQTSPDTAPKGPDEPHPYFTRVVRGGSWYSRALECRVAARHAESPAVYDGTQMYGFRTVLPAP